MRPEELDLAITAGEQKSTPSNTPAKIVRTDVQPAALPFGCKIESVVPHGNTRVSPACGRYLT